MVNYTYTIKMAEKSLYYQNQKMASKRKYESEFSDDLPAAKPQKLNRNFKDSWKFLAKI